MLLINHDFPGQTSDRLMFMKEFSDKNVYLRNEFQN